MATAANVKKVYISTSNSAPSGSDEVLGVQDCSANESRENKETTAYSDGVYKVRTPLLVDVSVSMSGQVDRSNAPQNLIRSGITGGTLLYVTVLHDGTNGKTYPVYVSGYEESGEVADALNFSATFELSGTPTNRP